MKYKRLFVIVAAALALCTAVSGCGFRSVPSGSAAAPQTPENTAAPEPEVPVFTVTYTLDGQEIGTERVTQ